MQRLLTIAQESVERQRFEAESEFWGWVLMGLLGVLALAIGFAAYVFVVMVPRKLAKQDRSSSRVIELLESIDRRLADRDRS